MSKSSDKEVPEMKFQFDHDYHIHSFISPCSDDPQQVPENILRYAQKNGLRQIVLTDHFWDTLAEGDEKHVWWEVPFEAVAAARPLPQGENTRFLFGCEVDMDGKDNIGIHPSHYNEFDFIIVPTTHMHLFFPKTVTIAERADMYIRRFDKILNSDLPFKKVGIAHLTCSLMANMYREAHLEVLRLVPDQELERLFLGAREKGCGIELNFVPDRYNEEELEIVLRPYRIAKACGCKFYLGSDAHRQKEFEQISSRFETITPSSVSMMCRFWSKEPKTLITFSIRSICIVFSIMCPFPRYPVFSIGYPYTRLP